MDRSTFANEQCSHFWLDPRTKILMLLIINIVLIGGGYSSLAAVIRPLLALLPLFLLIAEHLYRPAIFYCIFVTLAMGAEILLVNQTQGLLNLVLVIGAGLLSRFIPPVVMGYYVVTTTKISEFVAAMERMHLPPQIIIPFSVMLRFFPTVAEENAAISDAMRIRGIHFDGKNIGAMLEYRIVPVLICTIKIGEELSAAALTRGLGKPVKRTSICRVGLGVIDWFLIALTLSLFLAWIFL
ncbi:energy-coupling factor transporter transmembrane component T [Acetobacterium woodii]|uniref:Putative cobalt ABC transport system permease protein n=1 Tax=Acetobacterium woodii (strain ATCC 29683 / DSM 1030 / JCM 2381 / KCTC 1655 / WB1) TaxID=931626 RepID=H6LBA4_ACEWD|nr:energy-coupling factor transporter transmembrane component T [Acetobacterium woodii]AFA47656.1 putative cobalt ABC transport system permease protein [Acetobacterium woodii DSM 1030]